MKVIVTAGLAFGLTVSEAKVEITCLNSENSGNMSLAINAASWYHSRKPSHRRGASSYPELASQEELNISPDTT